MQLAATFSRRALGVFASGLLVTMMAATAASAQVHNHDAPELVDEPESFTSMFSVGASAEDVVDGGEPGATGQFDLRLDADSDTICFDIELDGVTPPYESPANTATHIHESPEGVVGPPRVAFPDPQDNGDGTLSNSGCISGPFMTGIGPDEGGDHGDGFTVADLEDDPSEYYVDTHTTEYLDGAVRGQLPTSSMPVGGMETGDGSATAGTSLLTTPWIVLIAGLVLLAVPAGIFVSRRTVAE